jgi:hypothetical protein
MSHSRRGRDVDVDENGSQHTAAARVTVLGHRSPVPVASVLVLSGRGADSDVDGGTLLHRWAVPIVVNNGSIPAAEVPPELAVPWRRLGECQWPGLRSWGPGGPLALAWPPTAARRER